ncbi:MAG TPA: O-methyltransferase [Myxococcota bacterium]|nr:O-methyltransferase [Myxococcota bacterium]HRY92566.1 O-methyltransferase [Myxococcota bacterium]
MIVHPSVEKYLEGIQPARDAVLADMEAEALRRDFPAVGPQVGALLGLLARSAGARRVLELGSGFGYSAVWFARALPDGGEVHLTDSSAELLESARGYLARAGLADRARLHLGEALGVARGLQGPFDLVFNDIDKEHYPEVVAPALRLLRPGGLLVTDNALWHGRVTQPARRDAATRGVRAYNRAVLSHPELSTVILPLRDGVAVSVKR